MTSIYRRVLVPALAVVLVAITSAHAVVAAFDPTAIVAAPDRDDADRKQDGTRHPTELLAFVGIKPGMAVFDLMAGGGYTTELLARAVGPGGTVYARFPGLPEKARQIFEERLKKPVMAKVVRLDTPIDNPLPATVHNLDIVTFILNYHDTAWLPVDRARMNKAVFAALKPGGVFIVVDHAAKAGDGLSVAKTLHRIEESVLTSEVEAAGFRLAGHADFLRQPQDPKDKAFFDMKTATDQFVLKFTKPA